MNKACLRRNLRRIIGGALILLVAMSVGCKMAANEDEGIIPDSHAPIAVDDTDSTDENNPVAIDVLANDTDPDLDSLTITQVDTAGTKGQVTFTGSNATYDPNGEFEYLDTGESDADTFAYTCSDGHGGEDTATVTVMVNGANDAPVAIQDSYLAERNIIFAVAAPGVLQNDSDVDGETLSAIEVADPGNFATLNTNGSFSYDTHGFSPGATTTFTYKASDGTADSNTMTVTIEIE